MVQHSGIDHDSKDFDKGFSSGLSYLISTKSTNPPSPVSSCCVAFFLSYLMKGDEIITNGDDI